MNGQNGDWIGWARGDRGPEVVNIKDWLRPRFLYARLLDNDGIFDAVLEAVVIQARKNLSLPSPYPDVPGLWDWKLQAKIGYKRPPAVRVTTCFIIPGTWAGPLDGPPSWVMDWVDKSRYRRYDVWYLARGFLNPDPNTSYMESLADGVEKTVEGILRTPGPVVLIGYSQGADVATHVMWEFVNGRLMHRREDLKRVICFGNPGRPPGPDFYGKVFPDAGISAVYPPAELRNLLISYDFQQDMYANANKVMRQFYNLFTRMELSVTFFMALLQVIGGVTPQFGGTQGGNMLLTSMTTGLFGTTGGNLTQRVQAVAPFSTTEQQLTVAAILSDLPGVAVALGRLLSFASTNAHGRYGGGESWLDYNGTDAVRDAANGLNGARF